MVTLLKWTLFSGVAAFIVSVTIFFDATRISDNFFANLITVNGIFAGFTIVMFTFVPIASQRMSTPRLAYNPSHMIVEWFITVAPFLLSITVSLIALVHQEDLMRYYGFVSSGSMFFGIFNMAFKMIDIISRWYVQQ